MRETDASPPAMSHSPAYHPHYTSPASVSPPIPPPHRMQRPVPAHLTGRIDKLPHGLDHIKASVSSATSGSTDATDPRLQTVPQAYQYHTDLERGHAPERSRDRGYRSPPTSTRISHSRQRPREMEQAPPSTVIRYIQQDVEEDEEDVEEPDHAIWILVSLVPLSTQCNHD